jgi:hypothetical protein
VEKVVTSVGPNINRTLGVRIVSFNLLNVKREEERSRGRETLVRQGQAKQTRFSKELR